MGICTKINKMNEIACKKHNLGYNINILEERERDVYENK